MESLLYSPPISSSARLVSRSATDWAGRLPLTRHGTRRPRPRRRRNGRVVTRGALRLRVAVTGLKPGAPVVVSIRPHEIRLVTRGQPGLADPNVLTGVVQRASYLGDAVDYQVRVNGSDVVLRVTAPPPAAVRSGETVTLAVAPEACVPLTDSETP